MKFKEPELVLLGAFRYSLGRMTYMVGAVVDEICNNWDDIRKSDQELIHREIKEGIQNNKAGMNMDVDQWKRILELEVKVE